jgi:K(+)-stimulated pyrophosphate-energized sodium pump
MNQIDWIIPGLGLLGLAVMIVKAIWVSKQDAGDANMVELAGHISKGALAFLRAEWKVLGVFVVLAAALLGWSAELPQVAEHTDWLIAVAFVIGAFFSAFAGWIGMNIATKANVRTTQAARTSLAQALKVSFTGGTVMGLGVAGLAVLGLGTLYIVFIGKYPVSQALEVLAGFSLG